MAYTNDSPSRKLAEQRYKEIKEKIRIDEIKKQEKEYKEYKIKMTENWAKVDLGSEMGSIEWLRKLTKTIMMKVKSKFSKD